MKIIFFLSLLTLYAFIYPIRLENKSSISNKQDAAPAPAAAPAEGEKKEGDAAAAAPAEGEKKEGNATTGEKEKEVQIITSPPFNITNCGQVIQYEANTLSSFDDYTSYNKPAFFTMSVVMINMFESKTSHLLLESINLAYLSEEPYILLGSTKCVMFKDSYSKRNITLCAKTPDEANQIIEAFKKFLVMRHAEWQPDDPFSGRVVRASCNGIKAPDGRTYDFLETQQIFKKHLEDKGVKVENTAIDPRAMAKIRNEADRIKASRYLVPGSEPDLKQEFYDVKTPPSLRGNKSQ